MRRAAVFLALLLCLLWTGAQGEDGGGTGKKEGEFDIQVVKAAHDQSSSETQMSTDVWAELKELRDMAIKHRIKIQRLEQDNTVTQVRLTASESKNAALEGRMSSSEKQVEELQRENADLLDRVTASENKSTALENRMSSSEKEVEELQRENTALEAKMSFSEKEVQELKIDTAVLESRMSSSEKEVQELQRVNAALEARMSSSEKEVEEVKRVNADLLARVTASENKSTALESRMSSSEKEVEELQRENTDRPQVAFSAGLTDSGSVGPFTTDTTLKYSKVFTNIGQAYSPTTGIFTAPVGGVYYFRFNMWGDIDSSYTHVGFFHNDQRKMMLSDYNDGYGFVSASNSMVLQLEKGDVVYIVLNSNNAIFDDSYNRIIFSGFLLFPL
ncbi:putative WEB family protein At1g65010, chloroplastic isoform X2 [Trematomus bernacchii]|uniref:putative WEB family protein At1g65010, chloroplastic isoform X2 n=1 Tax=Trematomus bernacchii TaxID=40690 RepID=UPI00146B6FBD|nr:putative WEB family protein At1g65010, chloroplastic isoform X2 [Trematomus bernacchii]